jgi:hypothetical protein
MTFTIGWRRAQGYRDWVSATTPVLWNEQTGEVVPLEEISRASASTWWLRRRMTLPVSSHPLFLTVPVQLGRTPAHPTRKHGSASILERPTRLQERPIDA